MKIKYFFILACFVFVFTNCTDLGSEFEFADESKSFAVPLVYGKISLEDLVERADSLASVRFDGDGKVTALYSGNVLKDNAAKIFPPVYGILDFPLLDTNTLVPLPIKPQFRIDKGIFNATNLFFNVDYAVKENIKLIVKIPSITLDGIVWKHEYNLDFANDADGKITTTSYTAKNWTALPSSNNIQFQYEAYRPNGERIILDRIALGFDILDFSYLDGYFGNHVFDIKGDFIKIDLFDKWVSGGFEISDPIIRLLVDNAFGFPVRSQINQLSVKNVNNEDYNVESSYVNTGINFAYPTIAEVGQVKRTDFTFTSSNSNIGTLFKDKITQVSYDFDALANPDGDQGQKNFFTNDAFFSVMVDVELPMHLKTNTFTITDKVEFTQEKNDDVKSGQLKIILKNTFPMDMKVITEFTNENDNVIISFKDSEAIDMPAATLGSDGKTTTPSEKIIYIDINELEYAQIFSAKNVKFTASFDSSRLSQAPVWIYKDYALDIEVGAIVNTK